MARKRKKKTNHESKWSYAKIMIDGKTHWVKDFLKDSNWHKESIRWEMQKGRK